MSPISRRGALAIVVVLVGGSAAGVVATLPDDDGLTPLERHRVEEAREERLMLQAPPDTGAQFRQAPYESANTDGEAGSGGRAVAYRSGGRRVETPEAVAAAPEARLWRTGFGSWEPSMGVNRAGTLFFSARNTNADPGVAISDDGGRTWRRSKPPQHNASLDPFIWVDEDTGSVFASDIDPPITCTPISRSDDDGKTWRYSRACGVTDHQNHFGGPPPADGEKPTGYPNVLYYCAISGGTLSDMSTFTGCLKSLDGGLTWTITGDPAYPPREGGDTAESLCNGASGHGIVDHRGTVYVPRGWCGPPTIAISRDEGATWTRRQVSDRLTPASAHETSVAADEEGNLYYAFVSEDHRAYLAVSRDGGNTWEDERDITPPGVNYVSAFAPHVDAGAAGRIAYVFVGTADAEPGDESRWAAYMGQSHDALSADPLFYAAPANDPATNVLWKGSCDDLRCGNLGDFLAVHIGPDGSAWSALVDSCPGADDACIVDLTITTPRGEGVVGQLVGGAPLVGTAAEQRPQIVLPPVSDAPPGPPGTAPRRCRSRRNFSIRLREPKRGRLVSARVYVNGKRVKVVKGKRLRARVNLRGLPKGRYTVRVVAITSTGRRVSETRRYRTCTPARGRGRLRS
ncbi:MAG TPA: sialidase family protein [Solirubrobacteraceae bacterium]|nr:sialidase family protein [Solirubrobacteraceae bacterium]